MERLQANLDAKNKKNESLSKQLEDLVVVREELESTFAAKEAEVARLKEECSNLMSIASLENKVLLEKIHNLGEENLSLLISQEQYQSQVQLMQLDVL